MIPGSRRTRVVLALMAVYLFWGSTYFAIRKAVDTIPPLTMAGGRSVIAGGILYLVSRLRGDPPPAPAEWRGAAWIGGLMLVGGNGAVCWAVQEVPTGVAALLVGSTPLWVALFELMRPGGERPGFLVWLGLLLGFGGVALLVGPSRGPVAPVGAAILILAAICWAAGSIWSRDSTLPRSPLMATAAELLAGGGLLAVAGGLLREWGRFHPVAFSPTSMWAVAYLVVFGSLVGFTAYIWLLRSTTMAVATTYAYVNPVVALILGRLFNHEPLSGRTGAASVVILGSVALMTLARSRQRVIIQP